MDTRRIRYPQTPPTAKLVSAAKSINRHKGDRQRRRCMIERSPGRSMIRADWLIFKQQQVDLSF
jgi:hypothetical protein